MPKLLSNPVVLAWLALVVITVLAWAIGMEHGFARTAGPNLGLAAVLALAFVKVQIIGSVFMELHAAPRWLRLAFSGWVVGVGAIFLSLYLWL